MGKVLTMKNLLILSIFFLVTGCQSPKYSRDEISSYKSEIEVWHKNRVDKLLSPTGWVNVRGLFWLKEGINSFGSDPSNDLVFPEGKINSKAGFFVLRDSTVSMELLPDVTVTVNGKLFTSSLIYHPDSSRSKVLESGPLQWFIIRRSKMIGVRLRDFESEKLKEFKGIEYYEPDLDWKLEAKLSVSLGKKVEIANVLGQTYLSPVKGTLTFNYMDKEYSLDAIDEDGKLFIIYGDATNGMETYGSGRYLYADMPTEGDVVLLDFNKSTNPPCAFTDFATCPLPPKQNILPIEVTAGEKDYH